MNGLALCSGVGGLELGLRVATGGRYRTVCHVEWEGYAAATLVARMDDSALDRAPIWDDLESFDGEPWRGVVDCITAGIPCQPYSDAGARAGNRDRRALWPELVRIVEEVRPAVVFLENVPRFLAYFEPVYSRLRALDFEFAPPLLHAATECGAPHIRKRLFILAVHRDRLSALASSQPLHGLGRQPRQGYGSDAPDANGARQFVEWRGWVFDRERQTLRHDADGCGPGCRICGSHWQSESPVLRVDARPAFWMDELRTVGNGVSPDVAASAWRELIQLLSGGSGT